MLPLQLKHIPAIVQPKNIFTFYQKCKIDIVLMWLLQCSHYSNMSQATIKPLLDLTRRSAVLTDSYTPWRALVEDTPDHLLLHIVRECSEEELEYLGYYGIALGRHQFIKWWWNRKSLPQIQKLQTWIHIIVVLELYRLRIVKWEPVPMLLAIFKSAALRSLYPRILAGDNDPRTVELRMLLVEMATAIPNGTDILYSEWKKYSYDVDIVWNFEISFTHKTVYSDTVVDVTHNAYSGANKRPLQQICRYGNLKDFKVALRNSNWWNKPKKNFDILLEIASNKNNKVFRYFMETVWSAKKACQSFPDVIAEQLWNSCYLKQIIGSVGPTLLALSNKIVHKWRYRIQMLHWLCEDCTVKKITATLDQRSIQSINPKYNYCTFYHFVKTRPTHPKPEDILWVETQQPLVTPKADGVYYCKPLPECQPAVCIYPRVQAENVNLGWCNLYMVFDAHFDGVWDQRINAIAKMHTYWRGPYHNLVDENRDLERFLATSREKGWKKIWWPKGVYSGFRGKAFFDLLSGAPITPYPNDGWVVAGCKGPLWKVKPQSQLTLDLLYMDNGWILQNKSYDKVITEFPPDSGILENVPVKDINTFIYLKAKTTEHSIRGFIEVLTLFAFNIQYLQNDKRRLDVLRQQLKRESSQKLADFQWMLDDPLVVPTGWKEAHMNKIYSGIWRCEWDHNFQMWRPKSRRNDKTRPNSITVENLLTEQHKYPWNPANLWQFYNHRPYYNTRGPKTEIIRLLFKKQKDDIAEFCDEHGLNIGSMVNLASGYKSGNPSYDLDPYIVAEQNWLYNQTQVTTFWHKQWFWVDACNLMNPATGKKYKLAVGSCVAVQNAIHYFAKDRDSWLGFMDTIKNQAILFITMIDADILFKIRNVYTMPDGSTMKRGTQSWHRGVWNGESCLKWNGGNVHEEPYVGFSFVQQELIATGWNLCKSSESELGLRIMYWKR